MQLSDDSPLLTVLLFPLSGNLFLSCQIMIERCKAFDYNEQVTCKEIQQVGYLVTAEKVCKEKGKQLRCV